MLGTKQVDTDYCIKP